MKKYILLFIFIIAVHLTIGQQNVGVGTATPDASAKLEVSSTTQGMLVPRMTSAQRIAISSPASGLLVFDMTTNSFWFRGGSSWVQLVDSVHTEVHRSASNMIYTGLTDNVGVGTITPAYKLQVKTGDSQYGVSHTNGTVDVATYIQNDAGGFIGTKSNHPFQLYANDGINQFVLTPTGNVGIGRWDPHAPLQFNQAEQNRKIVLYENFNNDHQFFGFGINSFTLRYQVPDTIFNHVFYTGKSANTSKELMRITGVGKVGIGIANPNAMLEITRGTVGTAPFGTLQINGTTHNSHFNYGTPEDTYIRGGKAGAKVIINELGGLGNVGIGTANPLQKLHVGGNLAVDNNVGIGNSAPNAPLQFASVTASRKIVLYENGNNDNQYFGFGINPSALRYQAQGDHVFYLGVNSTTSNELMRIMGNGKVGIGLANPGAMLEIARGTALNAPTGSLQVNGTTYASHFSYSTSEDTYLRGGKSGAKVIINDYGDLGNVGIGTSNPLQKLHVGGKLAVDNNVGIGNTDPHAPLQFSNDLVNRKIVLSESNNNEHQYFGLGVNLNTLRYETPSTSADHVFYAATSSTTSNELARIKGDGNVTISGIIQSEGWTEPTLINGYTPFSSYPHPNYYKDKIGTVHLIGFLTLATDPDGVAMFILPVGYRPEVLQAFPANTLFGVEGSIWIGTDGQVWVNTGVPGTPYSLSGITFRAN